MDDEDFLILPQPEVRPGGTCAVCKKPYVTIPGAIIRTKRQGQHWSGGEDVCWGRGECERAILAAFDDGGMGK